MWKWFVAAAALIALTPVALPGFWFSPDKLGISDWDYYFSYHAHLRRTITEYSQFPLWNPWICGGTAALGDPEFPVLTPTFLLELAFGAPAGLRLSIYFATAVGALGMLALGKRIGLSVYAALLAALAVAFSSVNILEIVEGHPNIFSAMLIPWIFWSWLNAYRKPPRERGEKTLATPEEFLRLVARGGPYILTGLFLAFTFFQGGVYLLFYTALALALLILLTRSKKHALLVTLFSGLWALGFAAAKLLPTIFWLSQFPDSQYASSAFTLPYLHEVFFGRYLHGAEDVIPNQGGGWHEYGAYIGYGVAALAVVGLWKVKTSRIVRGLLIAAAVTILLSSAGPFLKPFFDQVSFIPRSNISRVILFAVIAISLLAGYGLDTLRIMFRKVWGIAAIVIIALIAFDLFSLTSQLSYQAFVLPYPAPLPAPPPDPIAHTALDFKTRYNGVDYTRAFAAAEQGWGTQTYCSVLSPDPAARTVHDESNFGPVLATENLTIHHVSWSPNKVIAGVTASEETEVSLNTNYAKGWRVNGAPAKEINNRVGAPVPAGEHTLTFRYRPRGLFVGAAITAMTIAVAIGMLYRARGASVRPEPSRPELNRDSQSEL